MTDDSVQREIEKNQARKRDTEDVGLDEDSLRDQQPEDGNLLTDLVDTLFNPEDNAEGRDPQDHEFDDDTKT
jgi:hypothetical protein